MMSDDDQRKLEDRIANYTANLPPLIAVMLYRQLNRARDLRMQDIDGQIRRLAAKAEISPTCNCQGRHNTDTPFSHWLAADATP